MAAAGGSNCHGPPRMGTLASASEAPTLRSAQTGRIPSEYGPLTRTRAARTIGANADQEVKAARR